MNFTRSSLPLLALMLLGGCGHLPTAPPAESSDARPLVFLVSLDGFRWDYIDRFPTPNLDRLVQRGVRAERMVPSFHTKTFPNHYTLVTGLYPGHHGVVANNMYDPDRDSRFGLSRREAVSDSRWYGGAPIWVSAESIGLPTAPLFWPGSEAEINGWRPTYWLPFDDDWPNRERVRQLLTWLDQPAATRPVFLTLYMSDVDHVGHDFGPGQLQLAPAIRRVDEVIGELLDGLEAKDLLDEAHVLVVSDHGMIPTSRHRVIALDDYVEIEAANPVDWSPVLGLWPDEEDRDGVYRSLRGAHPSLEVFKKEELPERLHYSTHRLVPPIVGIAEPGWSLSTRKRLLERPESFDGGTHGYDPSTTEMGALFIAAGPKLSSGVRLAPFENVHVYSLLCHLLGVSAEPNDGHLEVFGNVLEVGTEETLAGKEQRP